MSWRERTRRLMPYVVTAIAGFTIAYLILFLFVFRPSVLPSNERVPDVVGMDYERARERLSRAGFEAEMGPLRPDPIVAKGGVIEQSPRAGGILEEGGKVVLSVSAGAPRNNPVVGDTGR